MSVCELNNVELKKALIEHGLYKPGLNINEMKEKYTNFKYKEAIEAEGLYESGMSGDDIKQVYNTLKKSHESANRENEYHKLMDQTDLNCSNIQELIDETEKSQENIVEKSNSTTEMKLEDKTNFPKLSKFDEIPLTQNINVFNKNKSKFKPLKIKHTYNHNGQAVIYYHQKKILKLPLQEKTRRIDQYLYEIQKFHKYLAADANEWSDPIIPDSEKEFNNDLFVNFKPYPLDEKEEISKNNETESPNKTDYMLTRSKRLVKRKNYAEYLDNEDLDTIKNKKSKSDDDFETDETNTGSKWISKRKKINSTPNNSLTSGSDRTNKIFDKLKQNDINNQKIKRDSPSIFQENMNLSDTEDEIFPTETVTTANIHKEDISRNTRNQTKTLKEQVCTKTPGKKKQFNKLSIQKHSATKENESPEIPISSFYKKNKNLGDELDVSNNNNNNNNKTANTEKLTNCPICNKQFPMSKIEVHASSCIQYEGMESETQCDICNDYIPDSNYPNHKKQCLEKITEESSLVKKSASKIKTKGFYCYVCDKYVYDTDEIQHASTCIAKVKAI